MENSILIHNENQLKKLLEQPKCHKIRVSFTCKICGKLESLYLRNMSVERGLVCRRQHKPETIEFTCEKCGEKTEIRRFLFEHKTLKYCERCTRIKNAGGLEEYRKIRLLAAKKSNETQIKRYGAVGNGNPEANKKRMATIKERYGDDFYYNVFHQAALRRTDEERSLSNEKRRKTMKETYGREFNKHVHAYYKYNEVLFDSSWEVYFYAYCIDNAINIKREPYGIEYFLKDGSKHKYYPDFEIPCGLVEIKSSFKMNLELDEKKECMKSNRVILIDDERIKFFKNYFEQKYGKHKIKELRCKH